MKFKYKKELSFTDFREFYTGKKNNFSFEISGYEEEKNYYVRVKDKISGLRHNSLWLGQVFKTLEKAQEYCEELADYYKITRIQEGTGKTENEKANNRIIEYINYKK